MKLTIRTCLAWIIPVCGVASFAGPLHLRDAAPSMRWAYDTKLTDRGVVIEVRDVPFRITGSGTGAVIETTGAVAWPAFGLPRIPSLVLLFEAPDGGEYAVSWSETSVEERPLSMLAPVLTPVAGSASDEVPRAVMKPLRDVAVYDRDAYWPDAIVRLEEARGAGRRFLRVEIFPLQYNPVLGRLRVHRGLSVVLSKREPAPNE